jgi:DNA-binding HxlR family transcriptional regulator
MLMEYYIKTIHLKNGKTIRVRRRKYMAFGDKYNASKAMALICFYHRKFIEGMNEGLTLSQVSKACPSVSYDSFRSRLGDLTRWGFLSRRLSFNAFGPCYSYSLTDKGKETVERIPKPMFENYLARIRAARKTKGGV